VDADGNVTGLIDLEWVCAPPTEMLEVLYRLADCNAADGLDGGRLDQFK
jgi:hypothetical protein